MLRQAKYRTTTEAVSKTVATKLPSILASVPLQITWRDVKLVTISRRLVGVRYLIQQEVIQLAEDEESGRENVEPQWSDLSKHEQYNPDHHHKEQKGGAVHPKMVSPLTRVTG